MNSWKWLAKVTALVLFSIWNAYSQTAESKNSNIESDLLVSGKIVPITDEPFVYRGQTTFTKETHAVVTLTHVYDGVNEISLTQRIAHVAGFPILFRLEGNSKKFFARPGGSYPVNYYAISATVYMGAGDEVYIGDYMTDTLYELNGPVSGKAIRVTGLEACGSPSGGGACATERRP